MLKEIYGSDSAAMAALQEMQRLGLLDDNGKLATAKVEMDGKTLTLEQVIQLLEQPDVNLQKNVLVDGTSMTLGDLKIMLEIEKEVQRLKDTYFKENVVLNDTQKEAFTSLQMQMMTEGLSVLGNESGEVEIPSGIVQGIYAEVDTLTAYCANGSGAQSVGITLKDSAGNPLTSVPNDISISYRFLDGSGKRNTNYSGTNGTLTFTKGSVETSKTISFTINNDTSHFQGQKAFLIQFYNPVNVLFPGEKRIAEKLVKITSNYVWGSLAATYTIYNRGTVHPFDYDDGDPFTTYNTMWLTMTSDDPYYYVPDDLLSVMIEDGIFTRMEMKTTNKGSNTISSFWQTLTMGHDRGYVIMQNYNQGYFGLCEFSIESLAPNATSTQITYFDSQEFKYMEDAFYWEANPRNGGILYASFRPDMDYKYVSLQSVIRFYDDKAPSVVGITVPQDETFVYGQSVPITVEFSEPVNTTQVVLTLNGQTLLPVETNGIGTKYATFLHTVNVTDVFSEKLYISGVTGAVDLNNHAQQAYAGTQLSITINPVNKYDAYSTANCWIDAGAGGSMTGKVTIGITHDEALTLWMGEEAGPYYDAQLNKWKVPSLYASIDGGVTKIDLYVDDAVTPTQLEGTFTPAVNTTGAPVSRRVEFYIDPVYGSHSNFSLYYGKYADYTVSPAVFLENGDFEIIEAFNADRTYFAEDDSNLQLRYNVLNTNATWQSTKDFLWSSSNPGIATIDQAGIITLTGMPGSVSFTLKALNGGIGGKAVEITTEPVLLKAGLNPYLTIPASANVITVKKGDAGEVRWNSNLASKYAESGQSAVFHISVFQADYSDGSLKKGASIYTDTVPSSMENPVSRVAIPQEALWQISANGRYSYVVEVSAENPYKSGETLTATGYIRVLPKAAIVKLARLDRYIISDNVTAMPIRWTLENLDVQNSAEFEFEILDNSRNSSFYKQVATNDPQDSYLFHIPKVENGLKDVYTITIKAKNAADAAWSYDSFVLSVYNSAALKILIDGVDPGSTYTMSNIEKIRSMSSAQILALKREIHLKNTLSINSDDHAWGKISDQIKWNASDDSVATINFTQGTLYENIRNYNYISYGPNTKFLLSGLKDGIAQVTATHVMSEMSKVLNVEVKTLKDKLYLFQVFPRTTTTLTYMNGNNLRRVVTTNDMGELALFEESGIVGPVYMKSTYEGNEYMGTIYRGLVSSEKDATRLELYPVNHFALRRVALVELYFKKPDGTPYAGEVTIRGGVYKEGQYCRTALINEKSGETDQTITLNTSGRFTVKMDASQFWVSSPDEQLASSDKLEFVYEARFPGDDYFPLLIYVSSTNSTADIVRFGDSTVKLEEPTEEQKYKPFIARQTADYGLISGRTYDIRHYREKIGPSQASASVRIDTTVLWWGEDMSVPVGARKVTFEDQYGIVPRNQASMDITYPFSSMKATKNALLLDEPSLEGWIKPKEDRGVSVIVKDMEGNQYMKNTMRFRIVNMLGVDKVEESPSLYDMLDSLKSGFGAATSSLNLSDSVIGDGFRFLGQFETGSLGDELPFVMSVSPTSDPTTFMALIKVNVGNMYGNATGVYADDQRDSDLDAAPSAMDIREMQKGKYLKEQKKKQNKNPRSGMSQRNRNIHFALGGYMEAEIKYNFDKEKWEIFYLNGGFNIGGGVSYSWNYNAFVGPVPVTATFTVGGTIEYLYKMAGHRGTEIEALYGKSEVQDTLQTLRLYAYIRAFGGVGFDYSVTAFKIGLFGQVSVDAKFAWLKRDYMDDGSKDGRNVNVSGRTGIEFVAKYLFVSYEKVFASIKFDIYDKSYGDWKEIQDYWKIAGSGTLKSETPEPELSLMTSDGQTLYPVSSSAVLEKRDYLEEFDRSWAPPARTMLFRAMDSEDGVEALETNAYPFANPVLSDDGQLLAYISDADSTDVEKTEVRWTKLVDGSYPNGSAIETEITGYGDSQLKLSGTKDFAAATWVRLNESMKKESGDALTNVDIALMSNSTEIMASVYNGAEWATVRLTENASPDMAPAVATNGDKVLVAWRSVYAADSTTPMNFDSVDTILYRMFDGDTWGQVQTLYNGTSGRIKSLEAAMLKDGTAAVTYTLDTTGFEEVSLPEGQGINSRLETAYAIIGVDGLAGRNVRLTTDSYLDENPQIATAVFDDDTQRFIVGWYSLHDADGIVMNDIRLCAFDRNGMLYGDFIDSINSINAYNSINVGSNFRFSQQIDRIEDLSILWVEGMDGSGTESEQPDVEKDTLKAVRFVNSNSRLHLSAPQNIAEMDDYTLIDHFTACRSDVNTLKAVILGTNYNNGYKDITIQTQENGEIVDRIVQVPIAKSGLYTATGTFENRVHVVNVMADYESVIRGMELPVQFTLFNGGIDPIDAVTLQVGDNIRTITDDFLLMPNQSITLTAYYDIPADRVVNPAYTVSANFNPAALEADINYSDSVTDMLYLDIPEVGISKLETVSEELGKRVMELTLYNRSDAQLSDSNRNVRIGFYSDPEYQKPIPEVSGQEAGEAFTVAAEDKHMIDEDSYTVQFTFDIAAYTGVGQEVPPEGIQVYVRTWVEEPILLEDGSSGYDEILEYYPGNNEASVLYESLLNRNGGSPVTLTMQQTNIGGISNAAVRVMNNSLADISGGNLIVNLLDKDGRILETLHSYDGNVESLISLVGEETTEKSFVFSKEGASVSAFYAKTALELSNNARLYSLSMTGLPFELESGRQLYSITALDMRSTLLSAIADDPRASISINGVMAESGQKLVELVYGRNILSIVVTAADGVTQNTYQIVIDNLDSSIKPAGNQASGTSAPEFSAEGSSIRFSPKVTAVNGSANFDVSDQVLANLVAGAIKGGSGLIIIAPDIAGKADSIRFELSKASLAEIATKTKAAFKLETGLFSITLGSDTLAQIMKEAGSRVSFTLIQKDDVQECQIKVDGRSVSPVKGSFVAAVANQKEDGNLVAALLKPDGSRTVIKKSYVRNGIMTIPLEGSSRFVLINNQRHLVDTGNHWAINAIAFVTSREIFAGTGNSAFSPNISMTRGMLITVLGKLSEYETKNTGSSGFSDVGSNAWYSPYVTWAIQNGITSGIGNNRFAPEEAVTREQLAAMLYRYIKAEGIIMDDTANNQRTFSDQDEISSFAKEAVSALQRWGIFYGKANNTFDPKGKATRAEVAAVIERLIRR